MTCTSFQVCSTRQIHYPSLLARSRHVKLLSHGAAGPNTSGLSLTRDTDWEFGKTLAKKTIELMKQ